MKGSSAFRDPEIAEDASATTADADALGDFRIPGAPVPRAFAAGLSRRPGAHPLCWTLDGSVRRRVRARPHGGRRWSCLAAVPAAQLLALEIPEQVLGLPSGLRRFEIERSPALRPRRCAGPGQERCEDQPTRSHPDLDGRSAREFHRPRAPRASGIRNAARRSDVPEQHPRAPRRLRLSVSAPVPLPSRTASAKSCAEEFATGAVNPKAA